MIIIKEISLLQKMLQQFKSVNKTIGFVPTMGALHSGHISLIKKSLNKDDITVVSIFINPTQFNDSRDYEKYPVTLENDILLLEQVKTSILFLPPLYEIYPNGLESSFKYNLGFIETVLEGFYRPGHFQGVCRVVHKLLSIIQPDNLFMGQKDYQQCMVINKLIELYKIPASLNIVPTERESTGLAMSSRNMRLSGHAKQKAVNIYKALNFIKNNLATIPLQQLKAEASKTLMNAGFQKIDYIEICDAKTLMPVKEYDGKTKLVALAAAFIEDVRLIDNLLLN